MALETSTSSVPTSPHISWSDSFSQGQSSMESLSSILPSFPSSLFSTENPSHSLLHDPTISTQISAALRHPNSGSGDNHLCRWLYDTFQFAKPDLQLVVLKFLPIIAGVYLSRAAMRKPLAGFEAVLLALYAHETTFRNGQAVTVNIPDLTHCSIYHETKLSNKNTSTELHLAVISPSLEPYGAVRSTRRARIVGVALELYYSKINEMPVDSKLAFCEFCAKWAGQDGEAYKENGATEKHEAIDQTETTSMETTSNNATASETNEKNGKENESHQVDQKDHVHHNAEKSHRPPKINRKSHESGQEDKGDKESRRIPLPWELLQPALRILGHCLMGPNKNEELYEAACVACRSLYARCLHDINSRGILATGSLLRLVEMNADVR